LGVDCGGYPDDLSRLVDCWRSILARGERPLRDESGQVVKWYGTNIDIEDRKRSEEAARSVGRSILNESGELMEFAETTTDMAEQWLAGAGLKKAFEEIMGF
jgi:hypothetical protein